MTATPERPLTSTGDSRRRLQVTAAHVAAAVGVSKSTVSLVINGKAAGRVSAATQERIRAAVDRLGYRVDQAARGLVTGRRNSVALVLPDIGDPFASQLAMGVAETLRDRYRLVLVVAGPGPVEPPQLADVLALGVDGVLVDSVTALQVLPLPRSTQPVVVLDAPGWSTPLPRIDFDVASGATTLADHLLGLGHRRIGYIDWVGQSPTFDVRRAALTAQFVAASGQAPLLVRSPIGVDAGAAAFAAKWEEWAGSGVTAVVCATDLQAYGVLRYALEQHIRVPDQLSVAGFNDLEFSAVTEPPLTSVRLSARDLGIQATELLLQLIEESPDAAVPRNALPAPLVVRASTAPAPSSQREIIR